MAYGALREKFREPAIGIKRFCNGLLKEEGLMPVLAWMIFGLVLGAAGSEYLRGNQPQLIKKVEDAAERFANSLCGSRSSDEQSDDEAQ